MSSSTRKAKDERGHSSQPLAQASMLARPTPSPTRDEVQRATLLASLSGQQFEDLKFFAFSRRREGGIVDTPLPLFVSSPFIHRTTDHFKLMFSSGFSESGLSDMDAPFPSTRASATDQYEYCEDSDLEDDESHDANKLSTEAAENKTSPAETDLLHGVRAKLPLSKEMRPESPTAEIKSDEAADSAGRDNGVFSLSKPGRVVYVEHIAHTTFKAFLFWAYMDVINFAPLKSQQRLRVLETKSGIPLCSPKSMYRLAHEYNIEVLKTKTVEAIKSKLSPRNILEEVFSHFTSLYDEIRIVELEYLHANIKDQGIQTRLPVLIKSMEDGDLPRGAHDILSSLIMKLIMKLNTAEFTMPT
ncbi:uncharacterized protein BXZ73DRAFT_97759 [Epithele typhae]|uniref:uncharacterized protein n=1 Tax=Epithele typhae TaxID=378194 RepID=UPI00200815A8|nr:uncharacterized protein BXZ73DRAFT_97759 [Epithele typhae]KAH9942346.1 hypothetical protein BXZ73DRAFT_97759 [Epithele typhae]